MLLVRPVREVEARGVHPRPSKRKHTLPRRRRWPERGDDLRAAWAHSRHGLSVPRDSNVTLALMDLRDAWERNAADWDRWARKPGHDSYWRFHRERLELVPLRGV